MQHAGKTTNPTCRARMCSSWRTTFSSPWSLQSVLTAAGADVIGPSHTVADALALVDREDISVAILDVRLGDDTVAPVARGLSRRKIPFVFYTGQGSNDPIWREWPGSKVIPKPSRPRSLVAAVADAVNKPTPLSQIVTIVDKLRRLSQVKFSQCCAIGRKPMRHCRASGAVREAIRERSRKVVGAISQG